VLVMAFFVQKHIVRGLTFGALKGWSEASRWPWGSSPTTP